MVAIDQMPSVLVCYWVCDQERSDEAGVSIKAVSEMSASRHYTVETALLRGRLSMVFREVSYFF